MVEAIGNSGSLWIRDCDHANFGVYTLLLAIRIWFFTYVAWTGRFLARVGAGKSGKSAQDWALRRAAKRQKNTEIIWEDGFLTGSLVRKNDKETDFKLNAKTHAAE